ncbi:hypothetical protein GWI33_017305 [Rhynchophorus ferrugineus]|uniref:Uncharacterized protein n=1 Tax=Rhynchophorus ferrugineus TaxID=354439 RepID=A0A834I014_RHYFE|nr:hypothetical protein GWI33_017305 [Rhynchophorus ferrugineus]
MSYVDALSRNPHEQGAGYDDIQMMPINVNQDDWVLAAQLSVSIHAYTKDEKRWGDLIGRVQCGLNTKIDSATGKSPYEVFIGYKPHRVHDAYLVHEVCDEEHQTIESVRSLVAGRK